MGQRLDRAAGLSDDSIGDSRGDAARSPARFDARHQPRLPPSRGLGARRRSLDAARGVDAGRLHRLAGCCWSSPSLFVLDDASQKPTTELTSDNLRDGVHAVGLRARSRSKSVGIAVGGHGALLRARAADRVLHRQGAAQAGCAAALIVLDAAAAVGRLSRQGLRVEGDAAAGVGVRCRHERRLPRRDLRLDARLRHAGGDPVADVPVAAVHGAADLRRPRTAAAIRCSTQPAISARVRSGRSAA